MIILTIFLFVLLSFWSVIAGIFKAGMEIGMLIVIAMIAVIVVVLVKLRSVYRKQPIWKRGHPPSSHIQ